MRTTVPREPTADQCSAGERVADVGGMSAYACWYPQMGGYVGKCVVVITPDDSGSGAPCVDRCFEAYVWHDGEFPFVGHGGERQPAHIHHCVPSQFRSFADFVTKKQEQNG